MVNHVYTLDGLAKIEINPDHTNDREYLFPIEEMDIDISLYQGEMDLDAIYRTDYDYASVELSAYKKSEAEHNRIPITYELLVLIDSKYVVLETNVSDNGSIVFSRLKIGQTYYINANDETGTYKNQQAVFTPTELDQNLNIVFLPIHNGINDLIGLNYTVFIKNKIDPYALVYVSNNPKVVVTKQTHDKYMLSGIPSSRNMTLVVEQYRNGTLEVVNHPIVLVGSSTPIRTTNNIFYEVPYRVLKNNIPTIDSILTSNPNYSRVAVESRNETNVNLANVAYISNGVGYNQDIVYDYTTSFKLSSAIDEISKDIVIKELIGAIANGDLFIIGNERIRVVSYSNTTNVLNVVRGVDGTIPVSHILNEIAYIEHGNILTTVFSNTQIKLNNSSKTFSNESSVIQSNDVTLTPLSLANRPYPPCNVKINGAYFPNTIDYNFVLTWDNQNKKQVNDNGWYGTNGQLDTGTIIKLSIYAYNFSNVGTVVVDQTMDASNTFSINLSQYSPNDTGKYRIILKAIQNGVESLFNFDYTKPVSYSTPYNLQASFLP